MDDTEAILQPPTFLDYSFEASANYIDNYDAANWLHEFVLEDLPDGLPYETPQSPEGSIRSTPLDMPLCGRKRKERCSARLPKADRKMLLDWFHAHISNPYPSKYELSKLASNSSVSEKQIRNFFMNQRARRASRMSSVSSECARISIKLCSC